MKEIMITDQNAIKRKPKMQNEYMFYLKEQGNKELKEKSTMLDFFFRKNNKTEINE